MFNKVSFMGMPSMNINSDWISNASSCLCIILGYIESSHCILVISSFPSSFLSLLFSFSPFSLLFFPLFFLSFLLFSLLFLFCTSVIPLSPFPEVFLSLACVQYSYFLFPSPTFVFSVTFHCDIPRIPFSFC